jgi:hypothetical protein
MIGDNLFRPYLKGTNKPVTKKWFRDEHEALDWGKTFMHHGEQIEVKTKDVNTLLKNRKRTGFRGLL